MNLRVTVLGQGESFNGFQSFSAFGGESLVEGDFADILSKLDNEIADMIADYGS
jgi:hypothetical protein